MKKALILLVIVTGLFAAGVPAMFCKEYGEVKALDKTSVSIGKVRDGGYEGVTNGFKEPDQIAEEIRKFIGNH